MLILRVPYYDRSGLTIFPDDIAQVKITNKGRTHQFHFHNSVAQQCPKQEIEEVRQKFSVLPNSSDPERLGSISPSGAFLASKSVSLITGVSATLSLTSRVGIKIARSCGGHMSIKGINYCDFCGELIYQDDLAPVKIKKDGHLQQFHFHNRNPEDCLAKQLVILDNELAYNRANCANYENFEMKS